MGCNSVARRKELNQALQHGTPPKAVGLKEGSIAVALEIEKRSCQQRLPACLPIRLRALHNGRTNILWNRFPGSALAPVRIRMPSASGRKLALKKRLGISAA